MHTTPKYLIHATVRTSGVVERSDVVGAIFGQTEGLLGDQLDLRDLQESSKLGRIDVDIDSEDGRSVGTVTIASALDRVETAVLAAALETIDRVGPCRAECTVETIEDARAAKRRGLVERATELLGDLEETTVTSEELVEEVRRQARVEEITEFRGFPAGPRVETSDALVLVEGRADVRRLLKFGIRNAVAVEGTDVPGEIAELTFDRNATAFLDGDRGGDLILRELQQVGDIDYVAFAPPGQSVEDLDRTAVLSALRRKVPLEQVADGETPREAFGPTDAPERAGEVENPGEEPSETAGDGGKAAGATVAGDRSAGVSALATDDETPAGETADADPAGQVTTQPAPPDPDGPSATGSADAETTSKAEDEPAEAGEDATPREAADEPETLAGHVEAVIGRGQGTVRFLDAEFDILGEAEAGDAFEALEDVEQTPEALVFDDALTQRLLDLAAQRGVGQIVAAATGEFVKQPTDVRVRTAGDLEVSS